jgi:hypothetical protein
MKLRLRTTHAHTYKFTQVGCTIKNACSVAASAAQIAAIAFLRLCSRSATLRRGAAPRRSTAGLR